MCWTIWFHSTYYCYSLRGYFAFTVLYCVVWSESLAILCVKHSNQETFWERERVGERETVCARARPSLSFSTMAITHRLDLSLHRMSREWIVSRQHWIIWYNETIMRLQWEIWDEGESLMLEVLTGSELRRFTPVSSNQTSVLLWNAKLHTIALWSTS